MFYQRFLLSGIHPSFMLPLHSRVPIPPCNNTQQTPFSVIRMKERAYCCIPLKIQLSCKLYCLKADIQTYLLFSILFIQSQIFYSCLWQHLVLCSSGILMSNTLHPTDSKHGPDHPSDHTASVALMMNQDFTSLSHTVKYVLE